VRSARVQNHKEEVFRDYLALWHQYRIGKIYVKNSDLRIPFVKHWKGVEIVAEAIS
jgi:hypothetical protein